jgi:putative DNA primase/helicase
VKIEGTTVKKKVTAKEFINNFLFNVDSAVATTLIGDDIKQRFSLKTPHISELISYYKEVSKDFFTAQKSKRNKDGGELPDWYEFTKSGGLRLMTGVLADYLRDNFHAFYATEQYYYYKNGVYIPRDDKDAKATVRTYLNPRDVTMNHIN